MPYTTCSTADVHIKPLLAVTSVDWTVPRSLPLWHGRLSMSSLPSLVPHLRWPPFYLPPPRVWKRLSPKLLHGPHLTWSNWALCDIICSHMNIIKANKKVVLETDWVEAENSHPWRGRCRGLIKFFLHAIKGTWGQRWTQPCCIHLAIKTTSLPQRTASTTSIYLSLTQHTQWITSWWQLYGCL